MKISKKRLKEIIKEELSRVLKEDADDIRVKIEALYTPETLSPDTRIVAALKMKLGELGFPNKEKHDMHFNEDYPATLSFGSSWDELPDGTPMGEWVLPLEGKRVGQLIEN